MNYIEYCKLMVNAGLKIKAIKAVRADLSEKYPKEEKKDVDGGTYYSYEFGLKQAKDFVEGASSRYLDEHGYDQVPADAMSDALRTIAEMRDKLAAMPADCSSFPAAPKIPADSVVVPYTIARRIKATVEIWPLGAEWSITFTNMSLPDIISHYEKLGSPSLGSY